MAALTVTILTQFSLVEINPDWFAYQEIYESGGAWLSDQGRDPVFLALIRLSNYVGGSNSYSDARSWLAAIFVIFSFALARGGIIERRTAAYPAIILIAAVANFAFARFTIQIREGIAAIFLVFGTAALSISTINTSTVLRTLFWLTAAALTHSGTALYLLSFIGALVLARPTGRNDTDSIQKISIAWLIGLSVSIIVPLWPLIMKEGDILSSLIEDRTQDRAELTGERLLLVVMYGIASMVTYLEARTIYIEARVNSLSQIFHQIIAGPLLASLYILLLLSILTSASSAIIAGHYRFMSLCLGFNLLLTCFLGKPRARSLLVCIFLISDQVRVIVDAVTMYFGVDLL